MRKIVIARSQNPLELSSIELAQVVSERLKKEFDVEDVEMPYHLSVPYRLKNELDLNPRGKIDDRIESWYESLVVKHMGKVVFNFRNYLYRPERKKVEYLGFSEWDKFYGRQSEIHYKQYYSRGASPRATYTIFIPAFYKPVDDQELLKNIDKLLTNKDCRFVKVLREYKDIVDLEKTREGGLLSSGIEEVIVNGIKGLIGRH